MNKKKRIVIVGATSSIAEHCARLWVHGQSVHLTLVGRDSSRLERIASDISVRSPESTIHMVTTTFLHPNIIQSTVDDIVAQGKVDLVLIAQGLLPKQAACQEDLQVCREALEVNGISPVLFAEAFAKPMAKVNHGTIVLIGSVAGDRGRQSNYVYGSAKGLVACYAEGLQHRFAGTKVNVILIKPGPTDTPMTADLKRKGVALARVDKVAQQIVKAVSQGQVVAYVPGKWRVIMWVIRNLPNVIFNKLSI